MKMTYGGPARGSNGTTTTTGLNGSGRFLNTGTMTPQPMPQQKIMVNAPDSQPASEAANNTTAAEVFLKWVEPETPPHP